MNERVKIGAGMMAEVYSWNGFAYKCFREGYPKEWLEFEYNQQNEVCKSDLPIPRYYESEFPNSIKMELISGISMFDRFNAEGGEVILKDLMTWFMKIHEVKGLDLPDVSAYLYEEIDVSPVGEAEKAYARQCHAEVEQAITEEKVLCHMDYHPLNVMYENGEIRIIDWVDAKNGKPIWDFSRTYVIFYEFAPGLETKLLKQICALTGYPEDIFMKAVYVNALHRLNQSDTERTRKLVELLKK